MTLLDDLRACGRVLLAHAHPDDETLSTGALALDLTDHGVEVQVVTATRGERGEVVAGSLPADFAGSLDEHRATELRVALDRLGAARHVFLGDPPARVGVPHRYVDSGMRWVSPDVAGPADDAPADAFSLADPEQAAADLGALVTAWRPEALVTYDADGGYGHPDHVRLHEVARVVCAGHGLPLFVVTDRDHAAEWHESPGLAPRLIAALDAHRTQLTVRGDEVVHVGGQRQAVETWFGLARRDPARRFD